MVDFIPASSTSVPFLSSAGAASGLLSPAVVQAPVRAVSAAIPTATISVRNSMSANTLAMLSARGRRVSHR